MNKLLFAWPHKDADKVIGEIRRFIDEEGKKTDIPFYNTDAHGFTKGVPETLKQIPYPLFGKDTILDKTKMVLVVEGQKCQFALENLGFQCVTSILGATNAHLSDWKILDGVAQIFIFPDNDHAGEKYAKDVIQMLDQLDVKPEIKIVLLPGLPPKGDVCDWLKEQPKLKNWNELDSLKEHPAKIELIKCLNETINANVSDIPPEWQEVSGKLETVASKNASSLLVRKFSDVQEKPISWLWKGRIARGKVSMIAGNPGLGKSQITANMAAIVTTGSIWPDGVKCDQGNVIFLSAEDDPADTIKPRLMATGANLDRVYVIDAVKKHHAAQENLTQFNLGTDLNYLDEYLSSLKETVLIVIDPISAYLGQIDSHRTSDVRALLTPLTKLAEKYNVAMICISHLNKGGSTEALLRVTGSLGFVAAARAAYIVARDKEDTNKRLFLPMKNNLGNDLHGLAFKIEAFSIGNEIETSRIAWLQETVTTKADDAIATFLDSEDKSALSEAEDFLLKLVRHGASSVKEIQNEVKDAGLSWHTIQRAKKNLRIEAYKPGMKTGWFWRLPTKDAKNIEESQNTCMATFANLGSLHDIQIQPTVTCDNCTHFLPDSIGNGTGLGHCKISAWYIGQPPLFPNTMRNCKNFKQK
jgi:putative DNA primase/helicase